ncbi:uncharacterized protein Gasu_29930 [Galdieria sulphuraria]|uniref:Uncharacterized protein n=1 Tax=Galdieria sulphuraria TaxID=130081 RepID=M2XHJ1_GALSU|nr:uncharacterized protein Gasu_29930 [Galdieria sulphuraria]EME29552.1 hypothetical protein Gasu_29930 [Galdieria sulphuraria]|eukprot:XP_005706072.1 hypothetical protein Gasu_29930 [Galdieria sulphuraria]
MYRPVCEEFLKTTKRFNQLQEETNKLHILVKQALQTKDWKTDGPQNYCSKGYSYEQACSLSTPQPAVELLCKTPEVSFQMQEVTLTYAFIGFHALTVCLFLSTKRAWLQIGRWKICPRRPIVAEWRSQKSASIAFFCSYPVCREWSLSFLSPLSLWKHSFQSNNLLCSLYFKISKQKQQGVAKFVVVSDDKQDSSTVREEDLTTNDMKTTLTKQHVTEFLSSLAVYFDDSVSAIAWKLSSSESTEIQQRCLSNIPYHPLNDALFSLFRESVLEIELTRKQALAKGGLEGFRWQALCKDSYWKDICSSVFSKLCLIDDYSMRADSSTSEIDIIDKVILKDCKWLADYLLTEIPHLLQEEKKNFCSQVTGEVLEKICKFDPGTLSSHF